MRVIYVWVDGKMHTFSALFGWTENDVLDFIENVKGTVSVSIIGQLPKDKGVYSGPWYPNVR